MNTSVIKVLNTDMQSSLSWSCPDNTPPVCCPCDRGPEWDLSRRWVSQGPISGILPSLPRFHCHVLLRTICLSLLPSSNPFLGIPKGQCHHLGQDKPNSFLPTDVSLHILEHQKENNLAVVFFTKAISKINNLLCL